MAFIAFASAKGSPGVSVTALVCTLAWSSRMVLVECDPAGGDAAAGLLRGQLDPERGLVPLAVAELRGDALAEQFWHHLVDLAPPRRERLLLPGIADPAQSGSLAAIWNRLGEFLSTLENQPVGYDAIADCGRLTTSCPPWPLLAAADLTLLAVRPDLPSLSAALAAVRAIRAELGRRGASERGVGLVVIGQGRYDPAEIAKNLQTPVVMRLPEDRRAATALTLGGAVRRSRPLLRAAAAAEPRLRALIRANRGPSAVAGIPAAVSRRA